MQRSKTHSKLDMHKAVIMRLHSEWASYRKISEFLEKNVSLTIGHEAIRKRIKIWQEKDAI